MTCTFFGHRNTPQDVKPVLHDTFIDLIENQGADTFYVGNQGGFDSMVYSELKKLKKLYPHIDYSVVLAYMPGKKQDYEFVDYEHTLIPDDIETVPKRFTISYRNKWMIEQSDYVVTYVKNHIGSGAAQFKEMAEKKGKTVINLCV